MEIPPTLVEEASSAGQEVISQCLNLLSRKNDTSRFVGLAMLLSIMNHVQNPVDILKTVAEVLNPSFLDRLLNASATVKKSPEEAKDMVELAVNVINAFARSLPDGGKNSFLVDRTSGLIAALPKCSPITVATILQILLIFAAGHKGARSIIMTKDLSPIVDVSTTHSVANQVLQYAFINLEGEPSLVKGRLEPFLDSLCKKLHNCDRDLRLRILSLLGELLTRIQSEILPTDFTWLKSLYSVIRTVITSSPSFDERRHCFIITASLLHAYSPDFLFHANSLGKSTSNDKPFVFLLLQLVTIDIRAAFPSLLEQLASPSYATTAQRLSADFDIIAAFLNFLVNAENFESIGIDLNLLLKLRTEIGETFGLTIEFLRDRWDAAYTGAAGFEPGYEQGVSKCLTWDSMLSGGLEVDVLIVGAVRALAFWLKGDEALRKEAGGLMDVFLGLWAKGINAGVDYRSWIIGALEGVLEENHGRAMFLEQKGYKLIWDNLKEIYTSDPDEHELQLAIEEARILVTFVKAENFSNELWTREVVDIVTSFRTAHGLRVELEVMVLSLASASISATQGLGGKFMRQEVEQLRCVHRRLESTVKNESRAQELVEILEDVSREL